MNLEKNVNFPNLRHRLLGLSFLTQPQISANRVRPMLSLALLLGLSSCTLLDREPSPGAQAGSSQRQAPAPSPASIPSPAIPVLEAASAAEQQALIDAINRDGQASNYGGFREDVPAPELTEGEDVVEGIDSPVSIHSRMQKILIDGGQLRFQYFIQHAYYFTAALHNSIPPDLRQAIKRLKRVYRSQQYFQFSHLIQ